MELRTEKRKKSDTREGCRIVSVTRVNKLWIQVGSLSQMAGEDYLTQQ